MTHIIGMAKSCLDLKGAKPRSLKLDFHQLVSAVREIRASGESAKGFLLVLDEKVRKRAEGWRDRDRVTDEVEVVLAPVTPGEREVLRAEKSRNVRGNQRSGDAADADASESQAIAEIYLEAEIRARIPNVQERKAELPALKCVRWDFYGQTEDANRAPC